MSSKLVIGLKAIMWLVILVVGVIVLRYVGEAFFYVPGLIAKRLSIVLTGSSKGAVTSVLFYLVAAVFVLAFVSAGYGMVQLDNWLDQRRGSPHEE